MNKMNLFISWFKTNILYFKLINNNVFKHMITGIDKTFK